MENVLYTSVVGKVSYISNVLGRYLSKLDMSQWQVGTKEHLLTYRRFGNLETLIATLITEAEYVTCYEVTHQVVWLRNCISKFYLVEICMFFSFYTKYMFVREKVEEFQTLVEHIPIELMVANHLTKDLPIKIFVDHLSH
ncbi:hypothetical protein CR513_44958, partial [Mucuna pruriens]